jgi:hypothetical protein
MVVAMVCQWARRWHETVTLTRWVGRLIARLELYSFLIDSGSWRLEAGAILGLQMGQLILIAMFDNWLLLLLSNGAE